MTGLGDRPALCTADCSRPANERKQAEVVRVEWISRRRQSILPLNDVRKFKLANNSNNLKWLPTDSKTVICIIIMFPQGINQSVKKIYNMQSLEIHSKKVQSCVKEPFHTKGGHAC